MRLLPFLLSLVGGVVASHDICYFINDRAAFTNHVELQLRDSQSPIYSGYDTFGKLTKMYVFKDPRGTIYVNKNGGFSVNWDGIDWGGFSFQKEISTLHTKLKYGCYDTSNNGYCKYQEEHWKGCQEIMTGPNAPLNSRLAPRRWVQ